MKHEYVVELCFIINNYRMEDGSILKSVRLRLPKKILKNHLGTPWLPPDLKEQLAKLDDIEEEN